MYIFQSEVYKKEKRRLIRTYIKLDFSTPSNHIKEYIPILTSKFGFTDLEFCYIHKIRVTGRKAELIW